MKSMIEQVILVTPEDQPIGTAEKLTAHQQGLQHRAFSVLLFNRKKQMLLQRRSHQKYHSPLLWANTCCGHPRPSESTIDAAHRRLKEELGIQLSLLKQVGETSYKLPLMHGLIEHEYTHLFVGLWEEDPSFCSTEVDSISWQSIEETKDLFQKQLHSLAPWFVYYLKKQILDHCLQAFSKEWLG